MSHSLPDETPAEGIRSRYRRSFADDFLPNIRYEQMPGADERTAYAAEFVAYRLGQIDEKLGRLIDIMERQSAKSEEVAKGDANGNVPRHL